MRLECTYVDPAIARAADYVEMSQALAASRDRLDMHKLSIAEGQLAVIWESTADFLRKASQSTICAIKREIERRRIERQRVLRERRLQREEERELLLAAQQRLY